MIWSIKFVSPTRICFFFVIRETTEYKSHFPHGYYSRRRAFGGIGADAGWGNGMTKNNRPRSPPFAISPAIKWGGAFAVAGENCAWRARDCRGTR